MEILFQGKVYSVDYFPDDTIEIVRQKIGIVLGKHPDNLFILINLELPSNYYQQDPRRLESLFQRVSYDGLKASPEIFDVLVDEYIQPKLNIKLRDEMSRNEWMHDKDFFAEFRPENESRIFGVEEELSYILPIKTPELKKRIDSTKFPIPNNTKLFLTMYSKFSVKRFIVDEYDSKFENVQPVYFPLFRSEKTELTEDIIQYNKKTTRLLNTLFELNAEEPEKISILRTRFFVPFVDTDFGNAVRSKFEQIFYGLTVSTNTPYIGYFTSSDELSRHKFFVDREGTKNPQLDLSLWSRWWTLTRPSRNKPTLVLFRGKTKHDFDRIAITSTDIIFSTYRPEKNSETIDELKSSMMAWFNSLDGVVPFVDPKDIDLERWDLQDMNIHLHYKTSLESFDLRRFECLSSVYNIADKKKSQFGLLRTDKEESGLNAIEVKIIFMLGEGSVTPKKLSDELGVSLTESTRLIKEVETKIAEDPKLSQRAFRKFPSMLVGTNNITFSSTNNLEYAIKYSNILRHILTNPDTTELDEICPRRIEESKVAKVENKIDISEEEMAEYGEFFDEGSETESEPETVNSEFVEEVARIKTSQKQGTIYSYFKLRLQQFDPITFHASAIKYPKKCEQKHQPIILSENDLIKLRDTPYNPKAEGFDREKVIDIEDPNGSIICPEYWCIRDEIPLRRDQLVESKGELLCPKCRGKLEHSSSDDLTEFPLRKRESGFTFPGYTKYKSPKNDKEMPCCFKRNHSEKIVDVSNKFYILGEDKWESSEDRIGFIKPDVLRSLYIDENYKQFEKNMIVNDRSGYFRVSTVKILDLLPKLTGSSVTIPKPIDNIKVTIRCSFFSTWDTLSEKHLDKIMTSLEKYPEYTGKTELAKIISGINEAVESDTLTPLQQLEYAALSLQCDVFRIYLEDFSVGCFFFTDVGPPKKRAIIVIQKDENLNFLANVSRHGNNLTFQGNIYKEPFDKKLQTLLEQTKKKSCKTEIPLMEDVFAVTAKIMNHFNSENFKYVLDPFGQAQAIFLDQKNIIIPFQTSFISESDMDSIIDYSKLPGVPLITDAMKTLELLSQTIKGYTFKENLYDSSGLITELLTVSGLRIPVNPSGVGETSGMGETTEVLSTLMRDSEEDLVFGLPSEELKSKQREISYSSEIYEFLLFQLSKDLEIHDNDKIRNALEEPKINRETVSTLLKEWYDNTVMFANIDRPIDFISKVRQPCGQFTQDGCKGNLCGWDGKTCRIKIRNTIKKDILFNKFLSTLVENSKIRSVILDGRSSPFFSTVLYQDLPTEVIMTDNELPI